MAENVWGALQDKQFWSGMADEVRRTPFKLGNWGKEFINIADRASDESNKAYPGQDWDSTQKNALRHSLWTGMNAQHFGGGELGGALARVVGVGWEGLNGTGLFTDPKIQEDTRHDLNANSVGIREAMKTDNQDELVQQLKKLSASAKREKPPAFYEGTPGHLTYTESKPKR